MGLGDAAVRAVRVRAGVLARVFRFGRGEGALSALAPVDPELTLRLAEPREAAADLAKVYDTVLSGQPGFFTRDEDWWERVLDDPAEERQGKSPLRCVLATGDDGVRGYSLYRSTPRWEEGTVLPDGVIDVWELISGRSGGERGTLA